MLSTVNLSIESVIDASIRLTVLARRSDIGMIGEYIDDVKEDVDEPEFIVRILEILRGEIERKENYYENLRTGNAES